MAPISMDLEHGKVYRIGSGRSAKYAILADKEGIFPKDPDYDQVYALKITAYPYSQFPVYQNDKGEYFNQNGIRINIEPVETEPRRNGN